MAGEQLTIVIEGGGPYGFRLFGGDGDVPLVIAKLRKKSKAWECGLEEGDELLSINNRSCRNMSHAAAMNLVDNAGQSLNIKILRRGGGGSNRLQAVNRSGSRQRSLTPSNAPSFGHNETTKAPTGQPLSESSRTQYSASQFKAEIQHPVHGFQHPQQQQQQRFESRSEFQFQLHTETRSHANEDQDPNRNWKPAIGHITLNADYDQDNAWKSPSQKRRFSPSSAHQKPGGFQTDIITGPPPPSSLARSPVVWKPPSMQARKESPGPVTFENRSRPQHEPNDSHKENAAPRFNSRTRTPTFQVSPDSLSSAGDRKPMVWQPSVVNRPSVKSPSPLASFNTNVDDQSDGKSSTFLQLSRTIKESFDQFGRTPAELPANLNKILAPSQNSEYDDIFNEGKEKKKVFVDSSFYDDPGHRYPTVDEQIKMARKVALSLTAPDNTSARGHRMFMKRKETSEKWIVDGTALDGAVRGSDTENELYYNPTPWNALPTPWKAAPSQNNYFNNAGEVQTPLVTSKVFAPKLCPEDESGDRAKSLSADEFEKLRLFSQKTTHNSLAPQLCFNLAEDLRQSKGKGGQMFAKRRAKADEGAVEGPSVPDTKVLQKLSGGFNNVPGGSEAQAIQPTNGAENGGDSFTPVNRLKEMVELAKPAITPWDAMAEFGNVELAFEHLRGINFLKPKSESYADSVANSLQRATQKKSNLSPSPQPPSYQKATSQFSVAQSNSPRANNGPPELATNNNWSSNNSENPGNFGFSAPPPTMRSSSQTAGSGYRPVHFQRSPEANFSGGFTDL